MYSRNAPEQPTPLQQSLAPLHETPVVPPSMIDPHYLFLAGKYLDKGFRLFDEKTGVKVGAASAFDLSVALEELRAKKGGGGGS
jgi:hypothetical protein